MLPKVRRKELFRFLSILSQSEKHLFYSAEVVLTDGAPAEGESPKNTCASACIRSGFLFWVAFKQTNLDFHQCDLSLF